MGSGNSSIKNAGRLTSKTRTPNGPSLKTDTLINGGSSLSAMDSSYHRRRTDEESGTHAPEAEYEDGSLGLSVSAAEIHYGRPIWCT